MNPPTTSEAPDTSPGPPSLGARLLRRAGVWAIRALIQALLVSVALAADPAFADRAPSPAHASHAPAARR